MKASPYFFTDSPEVDLTKNLPPDARRLRSQIFTPYPIAQLMARWVLNGKRCTSLLDPAFGLGVFFRTYLESSSGTPPRMVGYELDGKLATQAKSIFNENGYAQLELINEDYINGEWESRYDGILCNPPYQKFRGLAGKHVYLEKIKHFTGLDLSTASNLYIYFLVKAVAQLADGGRAAFILPYEFLNADYGKPVKNYLIEQRVLRQVAILGTKIQPFKGVITTSCILQLERVPTDQAPEFVVCNTLDELAATINTSPEDETPKRSKIRSIGSKWITQTSILNPTYERKLIPLSSYGKVMRGIATGDNSFFVLRESQRVQSGLDPNFLLACLSKAAYAPNYFFAADDFESLISSDRPTWLLNATVSDAAEVRRYLGQGVTAGSHLRYLTRNRVPWYRLENKPPAPLLATTFSRTGIRWVRNQAQVSHLTAFHGFYPNPDTNVDLLHAYLITPIAKQIFSPNQREYGNGLHKFEPNDLNESPVVDFRRIPASTIDQILDIYTALKTSRHGFPQTQDRIQQINGLFENYLVD